MLLKHLLDLLPFLHSNYFNLLNFYPNFHHPNFHHLNFHFINHFKIDLHFIMTTILMNHLPPKLLH